MSDEQRQPDSTKSGPEETSGGINWKLVDRIAKLFVVALILYLCWNVLQSMFYQPAVQVQPREGDSMLESSSVKSSSVKSSRVKSSSVKDPDSIDPANMNQLLTSFTQGSWAFGDGDWQIRVYPETRNAGLLTPPVNQRARSESFNDQKYIDLVTSGGAKPKDLERGFQAWQTGNLALPIVLITHDDTVQVMRTRFLDGSGYSIVEGRPSTRQLRKDQQLLPVPEGVSQVAVRTDVHDKITSCILKVEPGFSGDLRSIWSQSGWQVQPRTTLTPDPETLSEIYHVSNEQGQLIEATFFLDKADRRPRQIMLIRLDPLAPSGGE